MTGAGLNVVDLSTLNTFQQAILFALLILGSAILVSSTVLMVRKRAFEAKLNGVSQSSRRASSYELQIETSKHPLEGQDEIPPRGHAKAQSSKAVPQTTVTVNEDTTEPVLHDDDILWIDDDQVTVSDSRSRHHHHHHHHRVFPMAGVGARPDLSNHPRDATPTQPVYNKDKDNKDSGSGLKGIIRGTQKYFTPKGTVSRNSQFHGLTSTEREELGGVEYKAVSFLSAIVPLYFVLFLVLGIVGVGGWLQANHPDVTRGNGLSPFWTGAFFAVSAFVNSGMSLLDANMTALQLKCVAHPLPLPHSHLFTYRVQLNMLTPLYSAYPLVTMGMLILAGNTLFPCFLRFIIWSMRIMLPDKPAWQSWRVTLDFILEHPRRVYTNLFPARHTWYLLGTIIILNGIDWAAFELLSIGNKEIEVLPTEYRVLDGLFQALVLVTIRNTNVYEERSLGIYAHDETEERPSNTSRSNVLMDVIRPHLGRPRLSESSRGYFVHQQLRSQLSHDIWWIALAVLFIAIAESDRFASQPVAFATFNVIFEVVSAYGCVGVSVGFPGKNYSFCGAWHPISKLILAAVALRGRHRGLPVAIDRAVMLPTEALAWAEEEDAAVRRERSRAWGDRMPLGSV
ncbi:Potassium transporter [Penicillium alfredii]|uniref:Potassium transporter n=1 Tax=Penicillium alfredii TaxID=1506179 RepID=A0A9W9KQP5_9EURO|nr:Potassium transporter [Penicillium alfredii]KAJ5114361.1 Potassium transporter [Penicillium alfredii]